MAHKDKKNASPRKIPRWFVSTETGRFLIFLFVEAIVVGALFCFHSGEKKDLEFTRTFILAMATVGGVYGLILAAIRSAKLSQQVETAQKQANTGQEQLFNQQLGQGATLLANDEMPIRRTGIRVLGDLAERTMGEPEQVKLIMRTIHDFVHANAYLPSFPLSLPGSSLDKALAESRKRYDIGLGIRTLASLYNKSGKPVELKKLVQFQGCYLEGLDFKDAELQGANFQWADCSGANFSDTENLTQEQVEAMIFRVNRLPTLPKGLENSLDTNRRYEFDRDRNRDLNIHRRFIESNAEWSEELVEEYLFEIGIHIPKTMDKSDGR